MVLSRSARNSESPQKKIRNQNIQLPSTIRSMPCLDAATPYVYDSALKREEGAASAVLLTNLQLTSDHSINILS